MLCIGRHPPSWHRQLIRLEVDSGVRLQPWVYYARHPLAIGHLADAYRKTVFERALVDRLLGESLARFPI